MATLALSIAVHGAALWWMLRAPPPAQSGRGGTAITWIEARLIPAASIANAPAPDSARPANHARAAPTAPATVGLSSKLAQVAAPPPLASDAPAPPSEASGEAKPARLLSSEDARPPSADAFGQGVDWPDLRALGPGSFTLRAQFGPDGSPIHIEIEESTYKDDDLAMLRQLLQRAHSHGAGVAELRVSVDDGDAPNPP